jgi:argininosuccinate lyase
MLGRQGIIPKDAAEALDAELGKIAEELAGGSLRIDTSAEDIHSFIEGELTQRLGETGKMLHAGRSRNDQVALDIRLYLRRRAAPLRGALEACIRSILGQAERHTATVMPGYTHLQRAQPVFLAHHLCAWASALLRDRQRLGDALKRIDECPLGAAALAGTGLPLDREMVSAELGFQRPTLNSMDSIADRDFALEFASVCAITMAHLSRFCEDICIWATEEFGFISLAEAWSTGSSIMPQKKNPDFAELIRGKSARTGGNFITLFTLLKGLPYAYNKDLQEDKEALFDSLDTLEKCLEMFAGMMGTAQFNTQRMAAACVGGFLEATDAAEYLVKRGLPFREAHEAAAGAVREAINQGKRSLAELPLETLKKHSALFAEDVYPCLSPEACAAARKLPGGPADAPRQIEIILKELDKKEGRND